MTKITLIQGYKVHFRNEFFWSKSMCGGNSGYWFNITINWKKVTCKKCQKYKENNF